MTLRVLPDTLVNQIAAGEVVERPSSVVKELVENSIDAGAKSIDVVIRDGGQTLISVDDDGGGMSPEELELCVERHATSKLPDENLVSIVTLGFRGEALPSIGGVARLSIFSRTPQADTGWQISLEGGHKHNPEPTARNKGTRVEVRDLFYATPARLKFLKTPRTEQNHVVEILNRLAMAHPDVAFTLSDGSRSVINLVPVQGDLFSARFERLKSIMGREFAENALHIDAERENIRLTGFASLPTLNRGNAAMQFFFVSGRPVRDRLLVGALRGAYRDFLAGNRHPLVALFLDIPPEQVDVNVHPAKTEVRFRDAGLVRGLIVSALKHALAAAGHRAATTTAGAALGAFRPGATPSSPAIGAYSLPRATTGPGHRSPGLMEGNTAFHQPFPNLNDQPDARPPEPFANIETPYSAADQQANAYPLGVARAQLHKTYVVAQTHDGIVIVDQHAAHERLVHERIKKSLAEDGVARQGLLIPEVVEMDQPAVDRVMARAAELAELGLIIESFGAETIVVRETPALLGEMNVKALLQDLADDLAELEDTIALKNRLGDVCATMACHGSIRAGRQLNGEEMNALLREMENTPHSGQCSHGRPTYVELKLEDIEKLFGRR